MITSGTFLCQNNIFHSWRHYVKQESIIGIFSNIADVKKDLMCQSWKLRSWVGAARWNQRWCWAAFPGIADERRLFHDSLISFFFFTPSLLAARDWFASLRVGEGELIIEIKWSMRYPSSPTPWPLQRQGSEVWLTVWETCSEKGREKGNVVGSNTI